ncbi:MULTISPECIES: MurR/RpiR family transcriptional regulator [Heyndrickxia]|uniref:MurR/RpiR family transcriptional regulator n=1 Tax=Heyndrickxia TaxID=2837504 RepID=UPI0006287D8D|nr:MULTISPECIES: MurR/RpiR family transcriptional regulator [Heyndrickxia]MEC2306065.1 MurR/RpiR family transcriptional regulator [Weizmannia sp. CD-2023]MEC2341880.1 MurR/RpiR family transcriptional regulator [Weizmannia sp. CD-2023]
MDSILERIQKEMHHFTGTEKKIGTYILEHPEMVPTMTTKDLSEKTGVSESSVVRFCKTIGIASFKTFKLELVKNLTLTESHMTDFSILQQKDSPYDLFQKVTYGNKKAIESCVSSLDRRELEKAANVLENARKVVFFGVGGSVTAAVDACYKFTRLGCQSIFSQDYHYLISLIPYMNKMDVFVALSVSGRTKDVLELADFAKRKGAKVIAITNMEKSPLYKEADIRLCTPITEEDFRIGTTSSRMAQLNIIDALYLSVFQRKGGDILKYYNETRNEYLRLRR